LLWLTRRFRNNQSHLTKN